MATGLPFPRVRIGRLFFALLAMLGLTVASLSQTARPNYSTVQMSPPTALQSAVRLGRMPATEHLNISVSLGYRDPAGMQRFVNSVSNPHSPNYRHFITPAEVGKRFGPLPATVEKVRSYLTRFGIGIRMTGDNGLSILADATVAQAEAAFRTPIYEFSSRDRYKPAVGRLFSFVSSPTLPSDIQPFVIDIGGLESFSHPKPLSYVTPPQLQTLYNLAPMFTSGTKGQGRTVAISNWDGFRLSNVPYFYSQFSLPAPAGGVGSNITVKAVSGGAGAGAEQGEGDLDIQAILGVAPLCNLVIYDGGASDLIGVLTLEANDNIADVISESYGWNIGASTTTAAHNLHLSMSAQGITYMAASGDSGTSLSYYYPNIEPEVLSVGGTTCSVDSAGNRVSETGWSGSGGGWKATTNTFNVLPSYQVGTGVPTNINYRLIPDVALDADPNSGYVVYLQGAYHVIGGTSGASPTFAGALGVSEQQLMANGALAADSSGHSRFGRIQDLVYSLNGDPSVFFDVTSGGNGQLPNSAYSNAGPGWDFVTGWGAMDFDGFVTRLSGSGARFTISPATIEGGKGSATGTVSTTSPAPSGGTAVSISGGDSSIGYPASVTIPAGSRSTTFTITTSAVSDVHSEDLTATMNSETQTANLLVTPSPISTFAIAPTSAVGGSSFTGTVTLLHAAASPSGDVVTLSGGDSSVGYPATVTVPSGATKATFTLTSTWVAANDVETITATLGTSTKSATVTLTGLTVSSVTFSPAAVTGGTPSTGTVTLSTATSASGAVISLTGGDSAVSYPATVTVPAKAKSVTFKVTTVPTYTSTTEDITATLNTSSKTGTLTVNRPAIASMTFAPTSVYGGQTSKGTITLTGPAGSSGLDIALTGGDSSISYPATVNIPSGVKTATFTVTTSIVAVTATETVTATLFSTGTSANLTVKPAGVVSTITFSPTSIVGGKTTTGTVKLTGAAGPLGVVVNLSGGDSSASYPSTLTIASGATSKTFVVTSTAVMSNTNETLTAQIGPSSANGSFTITAPTLSSLAFSPASVFGGVSSTGTVTLTGPAGSSGLTATISGGDASVSYPTTVSIPAGSATATFTVLTSIVPSAVAEALKATVGPVMKTATLTVKPAGVLSTLTFSPATIVGGKTTTGTIKLTAGAGPLGVVVNLAGGDSSISYPSTVSIAAGATSATFVVTSTPVATNASEAITATLGPSSAHGSFIVTAPSLLSLVFSPTSVTGGTPSTGTVTLTGPAGSAGVVVTLSGGTASVSFPSSVTIPAGAASATFTATTSSVTVTATVKITATLVVAKAANLTVKP